MTNPKGIRRPGAAMGRGGKATLLATSMLVSVTAAGSAPAQETLALEPIEVSGEQVPTMETTSFISQEEIDRAQPLTLQKLFQGTPEVTVPSGPTAAQKIYVHGIDQMKLNVRVDGVPQRNNVWHHNGTLTLDPTFLKAVAVEAGVTPAGSGFGGLAGAVLFTTKDAPDMLLPGQSFGGTVIAGYDTNPGTCRTTGAGYGADKGIELLAIGTIARGGDYEAGNGVTQEGTTTDFLSGLGKLAFETAAGHRFEVSAEHARDDGIRRLRPNMGIVLNSTGALFNATTANRTTVTVGYATTAPTDLFDPEVSLYYNRNDLDRPNDNQLARAHGDFNVSVETFGGMVKNTFAIPFGTVAAGIDFAYDDAFLERFHFATDAGEEITQVGGFAQARISPLEGLRLSGGARFDYQSYDAVDGQTFDNTGFSPNLSLEVDIGGGFTYFGGISYVWGGIEPPEIALFHARDYTYASDLDPTRALNFRTGMRYNDGGLFAEGAIFHTSIENPMAYDFPNSQRVSGEDLTTKGIDLAAGYSWTNAGINLKYTHTEVTYGDRMALPGDINTATPVGDLLVLNGQYGFEELRLTLGASAALAFHFDNDDLDAAGFDDLDPYQAVNLSAEWQPLASYEHWTVRVEANNILDDVYSSRSTYTQTAVIDPVLAPGRSFFLSTRVKF